MRPPLLLLLLAFAAVAAAADADAVGDAIAPDAATSDVASPEAASADVAVRSTLCGEDKAEGDCPVAENRGPLSSDAVAAIKAEAAPLPARVENYLEPFDKSEPCPDLNIMQAGNLTQGQVEAQVRGRVVGRGEGGSDVEGGPRPQK